MEGPLAHAGATDHGRGPHARAAKERDAFVAEYEGLRSQVVPLPDLDNPTDQPFSDLVAVVETESEKVFTFRVPIADDAEPGTYLFYCAVHGFGQRTEIEIKPEDASIPREGAVQRRTRTETKKVNDTLARIFKDATDDQRITVPGPEGETEIEGPFAGLPGGDHSAINEFVPKTLRVRAGDPITWKMMGSSHTISFKVPRYFPIMEFLDDGTVRINPRLKEAAGGAVPVPEHDEESEGPPRPVVHDGGEFDGGSFWSSGLIGAEPYLENTMRITKPGTYNYACLIHPPMVGKIEVT